MSAFNTMTEADLTRRLELERGILQRQAAFIAKLERRLIFVRGRDGQGPGK